MRDSRSTSARPETMAQGARFASSLIHPLMESGIWTLSRLGEIGASVPSKSKAYRMERVVRVSSARRPSAENTYVMSGLRWSFVLFVYLLDVRVEHVAASWLRPSACVRPSDTR